MNAVWNNLFDFVRRQTSVERWPMNFVEIHPDDAAERRIERGDLLLLPGAAANTTVAGDTNLQPINLRYPFKLGKGEVTRLGSTQVAETMSFAPRNVANPSS